MKLRSRNWWPFLLDVKHEDYSSSIINPSSSAQNLICHYFLLTWWDADCIVDGGRHLFLWLAINCLSLVIKHDLTWTLTW